jgi:hypothetical protein
MYSLASSTAVGCTTATLTETAGGPPPGADPPDDAEAPSRPQAVLVKKAMASAMQRHRRETAHRPIGAPEKRNDNDISSRIPSPSTAYPITQDRSSPAEFIEMASEPSECLCLKENDWMNPPSGIS